MSALRGTNPGKRHIVGISEMHVSTDPEHVLVTFSLGSCLGVTAYDPRQKLGALIHCMLPMASLDPEKAKARPAMFVDTGVMAMLDQLFSLGARREDLVVKIAGGASPLDQADGFRIGDRNYAVLRKLLWKNNILIAASDVGGREPRTMSLYLATGVTTIRQNGEENELQ